MRTFYFIFGIYILAISLLPCNDIPHMEASENHQFSIEQNHVHDSEHTDLCSPFCICSCCNTSVITHPAYFSIENYLFSQIFDKKSIPGDFLYISNDYRNIWQPPKVNA